jgi:hypothetical protein
MIEIPILCLLSHYLTENKECTISDLSDYKDAIYEAGINECMYVELYRDAIYCTLECHPSMFENELINDTLHIYRKGTLKEFLSWHDIIFRGQKEDVRKYLVEGLQLLQKKRN